MTKPQAGDLYSDRTIREGKTEKRMFRLLQRVNPWGSGISPYWITQTEGSERTQTVREDRLLAHYDFIGSKSDGPIAPDGEEG